MHVERSCFEVCKRKSAVNVSRFPAHLYRHATHHLAGLFRIFIRYVKTFGGSSNNLLGCVGAIVLKDGVYILLTICEGSVA